jgi:hypothetical protein
VGDGRQVHLWDPDDEKVVPVRFPNAALSQLQALTNQYNTALSSFAQSFKSEVAGGNVESAALICRWLYDDGIALWATGVKSICGIPTMRKSCPVQS